jgi:hypothetical protein
VDVGLVILGAVLATYGWYWGGVTESRTSAYAMGAGAFLLGLTFAFTGGGSDIVTQSLWALGAIFAFLATANAWNESSQDRTYGMFALLFGVVAIFGYVFLADAGAAGQYGYAALVLGVVLILHFISAALVPDNKGFKGFVGWLTLIAGTALVLFGYADALGFDFGTL